MRHSIPTRRMRIGVQVIMFSWMLGLLATGSAFSQTADPANAATWYQKAIDRLDSLSGEQREMLFNVDTSQGMANTPAEFRSLIVEMRPVIELARRGSMQQFSDFGLNHSDGIALLLPHLSQMRTLARLMNADARMRFEAGDSGGAAETLATMYRMSDHLCDDRVVISSMVGDAITNYADTLTQEALDGGKLNAADAMTLLKASMRMSPTDPFRYAEAVMGEQELMITTITEALDAETPQRNIQDLASITGGADVPIELLAMDKDALKVDVGQFDMMMDRVVEAFLADDREFGQGQLDEIMKEVENGEHGYFAQLLMPAMGKIHERMVDSEEALETRMNALRELASGEVTPGEAANAALWYLRGITLLEAMPTDKREQYRAVSSKPGGQLAEPVANDLAASIAVMGLFIDGAALKRCDFSFAREHATRLKRDYLPGMRDAARLLQADAVRLAQKEDLQMAAERLAVCFRMAAHLSADKSLLSSLTAQAMFDSTATMYEAILEARVSTEQKSMLRGAVERMSRKDPFGYIAAMVSDRELAIDWLHRLGAPEPQDEGDLNPSPRKAVNNRDADQVLSLLVMLDWLRNPQKESDDADPALQFGEMTVYLRQDKIKDVHVVARGIYTSLPDDGVIIEHQRAMADGALRAIVPAVANVKEKMTNARQALRDVNRKLQPDESEADHEADQESKVETKPVSE